MTVGIHGRALGPAQSGFGAPVQVFTALTVAGTADYTILDVAYRKLRVVDFWGYMTGAGASSDTVKLTDGTNDIVPAIDISAAADTDRFTAAKVDDAYNEISKGGSLVVTTASDATTRVFVMCEVLEG